MVICVKGILVQNTSMQIPTNKKLVCITGNVWSGDRRAPRRLLVKHGFVRPVWFTTRHRITDASYRHISESDYHLAKSREEVLVSVEYGSDFMGIMTADFIEAHDAAETGVLIVGPQSIAAQVAEAARHAVVFTIKDSSMETSKLLADAKQNGQLHRIDVDVLEPGAWDHAYEEIVRILQL